MTDLDGRVVVTMFAEGGTVRVELVGPVPSSGDREVLVFARQPGVAFDAVPLARCNVPSDDRSALIEWLPAGAYVFVVRGAQSGTASGMVRDRETSTVSIPVVGTRNALLRVTHKGTDSPVSKAQVDVVSSNSRVERLEPGVFRLSVVPGRDAWMRVSGVDCSSRLVQLRADDDEIVVELGPRSTSTVRFVGRVESEAVEIVKLRVAGRYKRGSDAPADRERTYMCNPQRPQELEDLCEGHPYLIRVEGALGRWVGQASFIHPDQEVRVELLPAREVSGIVVGPVGEAVPQAVVTIESQIARADGPSGTWKVAVTTDAAGRFRLAAPVDAPASLRASAPGLLPSPSVGLQHDDSSMVQLRLGVGRTIRGVVKGEDGNPIPGAHVVVTSVGRSGGGDAAARSDANGRFACFPVSRSPVWLRAFASGAHAPATVELSEGDDDVDVDLVVTMRPN
ncbi:MAG: carboxypeptidase regulatory-like domain-containing protein [Planctomycetes bacterium]|nr:carboxypeptidase regulatory-like domain-containing protein [Planctomycetota bacterium]